MREEEKPKIQTQEHKVVLKMKNEEGEAEEGN